ncbi:hypothetical protein GCM10007915_25350 [Psychrobacter pacificensis]|uniref:Uncharacterized protein n=1 Tax=Psychrobacter pacificensis TaxID=112002 RepID=A0ABQ5Z464_9GAMM|nr:hypothetical protein GCM10007915_25350 [Psychrobacter pacificensis]
MILDIIELLKVFSQSIRCCANDTLSNVLIGARNYTFITQQAFEYKLRECDTQLRESAFLVK